MPRLVCISSLPVHLPTRHGRQRQLTRRCALTLAAVMVIASGCRDDAESPTAPAVGPALANTTMTTLAFDQVSAGENHGCGLTAADRAYCWGYNLYAQLGDGSKTERSTPVAVAGGISFRQVSAGGHHTCGVTTNYRVYCWGDNGSGQLGNGNWDVLPPPTPVLVVGGHQFRQIEAGGGHTCGVSYSDRRVYCWGANSAGQLGDGTTTWRVAPVAVLGGRQFRQVSVGRLHTCALATDYQVYCWGRNREGQVGDGSEVGRRQRPVRVAGGRQFRQVDAGDRHTCGVTTDYRTFCWGDGGHGQIGDGTTSLRFVPRAVAGGLTFHRVSAGGAHTCGETAANLAYCWGWNLYGDLGDGTTTTRLTPVAVAGGLTFRQVSAGGLHSCGKTQAAVAHCWGHNSNGALGDGTTTDRLTPVTVAGTM
jgi:alpha-tubulin suppressor-like RCC1 family protein